MSATTTHDTLSVGTLLRLGRVSNLPTVWTNVAAATAIAGGDLLSGRSASVFAATTLFYLGGMYLNDAFDRSIDARERPTRPIPSGQISAPAVFGAGLAMLALGTVLIGLSGVAAAVAGLVLAGTILLYDYHHKGNPLSP
ncbi:MAG: UbiA family prenyltransferase, partial [Pseudomonadota bacterium]|nr:UbiA family prenyltransferase [Pseudomonadota bacterium]